MKYYLCIVGSFQDGTENVIIEDCIDHNIYQYHESTSQKGAGASIHENDTLILVYKKEIIAYGVADGKIGTVAGKDDSWMALPLKGKWILANPHVPLPYGVYWHILSGNKQSVAKEIDALWANELIFSITCNNDRKKLPTEPVIPLHLPTITTFFMKGLLSIPAVQRGKVWNAVRAEVLWDSLMRNIPIGTLSIRPVQDSKNGDCWELLDGQQRTNAIMLGYQDFPGMKSLQEEKEKSILWLDLGMHKAETEQNDGTKKLSERKFFFKVTTLAQPWGYKLSDNETQNSYLTASEKRESVEEIKTNWERRDCKGQRPYPYELWPVKAIFPVPFTALRSFCERYAEPNFEQFWSFCQKEYQDCNWGNKFLQSSPSFSVAPECWNSIVSAINNLNSIIIPALNSTAIADCDIGLYFKRMNKAGIEPDNEEIRYSLLKAKLPDLKELDDIAVGRMQPAQLANLVMLSYCTKKENKWKSSISFSDIGVLAQDNEFKKFIKDKFKSILEKIESWLLYDQELFPDGMPRVIYSTIPHANINLYRLLVFFADRDFFIESNGRKNLVALVLAIAWFGKNDKMFADCYNKCQKADQNDLEQVVKLWLFDSIKNDNLTIPPPLDVYEKILKATESKEMEVVRTAWNNPAYQEGINQTWYWTENAGRGLLLYSLRRYLQDNFEGYNAIDAVWKEESRPWDYDHIFPQDWLRTGRGKPHGEYHELVEGFLNSIGNVAPISFSKNRGKGASAPGKYQEDDNQQLYVEYSSFFDEKYSGGRLEKDPALAFQFAQITAKRLYSLYQEWYNTLDISTLLDFSGIEDPRRILFEKMRAERPECQIYFPVDNGLQYEWCSTADWARAWLACGVMKTIKIDKTEHKCFVCVASDGLQYEIGIRRHPEETLIDGKGDWWFPGFYEDVPSSDPQIDELLNKFEKVLEGNKERLQEL